MNEINYILLLIEKLAECMIEGKFSEKRRKAELEHIINTARSLRGK